MTAQAFDITNQHMTIGALLIKPVLVLLMSAESVRIVFSLVQDRIVMTVPAAGARKSCRWIVGKFVSSGFSAMASIVPLCLVDLALGLINRINIRTTCEVAFLAGDGI